MRATKIYPIAILVMLISAASALSGKYTNTYAAKLFNEIYFKSYLSTSKESSQDDIKQALADSSVTRLLKQGLSPDYVVRSNGVYKEYVSANPFLTDLYSTNRPDFEHYASLSVNSNPIAVLVSQCYLSYIDKPIELSVPDDFRSLLFLRHIVYPEWPRHMVGNQYVDPHMQAVVSKLFLNAVTKLSYKHFNQDYYEKYYACYSCKKLWNIVLGFLVIIERYDDVYAKDYLKSLLFLDRDVSRFLWDDEWFIELQMRNDCPTNKINGVISTLSMDGPLNITWPYANEKLGDDHDFWQSIQNRTWTLFLALKESYLNADNPAISNRAKKHLSDMLAILRGIDAGDYQRPLQIEKSKPPSIKPMSLSELDNAIKKWKFYVFIYTHAYQKYSEEENMKLFYGMHDVISALVQ